MTSNIETQDLPARPSTGILAAPPVIGLFELVLEAADLEAAERFYHDTPAYRSSIGGRLIALRVPCGTLAAAQARLEALGIPVEDGWEFSPGNRAIYVDDPDGNVVELTEHVDPTGTAFRVTGSDDAWRLERRLLGDEWNEVGAFAFRPHALDDFRVMCHHHQTSPESPFPRKRICTQLTADDRVTLSDLRLITPTGDRREERDLPGEEAFRAVLREQFGIDLDA